VPISAVVVAVVPAAPVSGAVGVFVHQYHKPTSTRMMTTIQTIVDVFIC
jgi:hypothetical protein